jgi:hypothetical protein
VGKNENAEPRLDPAKIEALLQRLERGELSEEDRLEVVRLLQVYLDLREKLAGSVPSVKKLRGFLSRRLKATPASRDAPASDESC